MADPEARPLPVMLPAVLDRAHPPVGRLRVMSSGMSRANTFRQRDAVAGSQACVSCGNCVDACPVLADRGVRLDVMRTSMGLETLVGADCRRCYRCVYACPQVDPILKDATRAHRRVERVAHYLIAVSFLLLSITGILLYYVAPTQPPAFGAALSWLHRIVAPFFLAAPLLYLLGSWQRARMVLASITTWGPAERAWLRDTWLALRTLGREGRLMRGDLNPAQRGWYLFIILMVAAFGVSGAVQYLGRGLVPPALYEPANFVHVWSARIADVAVLWHIVLKAVWPLVRNARNLLRGRPGFSHAGLWPVGARGR